MPITKSVKKAMRSSLRKREYNLNRTRAMRKAVNDVIKKAQSSDKAGAMEAYKVAQKAIDKAAKGGVIKKNTASRKKSRLVRMIKSSS
ncbi:MAG: 30S ribosomal protein S20 [Candidatus Campbellbacteria bacterium]|nr:30S ribosomal protein S20 [Candidatus Campbellbacteria bacterium]